MWLRKGSACSGFCINRPVGSEYRTLAKRLREAGCVFVREAKGSHEIWYSPITLRHFVVPRTIKATGTLRAICKQAGIEP